MCPIFRPCMGLKPWLQLAPHGTPPPLPPPRPLLLLCENIPNFDDDRLLPLEGELLLPELVMAVVELRRRGRSLTPPPLPPLAPLDHCTLTVVPRMTCVDASATTALSAAACSMLVSRGKHCGRASECVKAVDGWYLYNRFLFCFSVPGEGSLACAGGRATEMASRVRYNSKTATAHRPAIARNTMPTAVQSQTCDINLV